MANLASSSLRTVHGHKLRFDLSTFHSKLGAVLLEGVESPGKPGGHDPTFTDGPIRALSSYLLGELVSKYDDGVVSPAKVSNTWARFHEAEALCFETNHRLTLRGFGPYEPAISLARKIISKILGRFDWEFVADHMDWGPGASTRLTRARSDAAYKYSGNPETTIGNAALANAAICYVPLWKQSLSELLPEEGLGYCKIVPGNRIITVPKNYKTDRTIAIEPDMNMYVQKGFGGYFRHRLRLSGCNLDDQTRNQRLARVGSVAGTLATIDLSMASDTVSRVLVKELLPDEWHSALEMCRCPFGVLPSGEKIFYQKFSSMGNGFTFELESMIFYALALAWTHLHEEEVSRVSVYGDDIILPSTVADSFGGLLSWCGFKLNANKSYWTGPFRESCGKHYFQGHDISPFYLKRPVRAATDLFLLHNNLLRWMKRADDLLSEAQKHELGRLLSQLRAMAPSKWRRPRLPDGFGDGAFVGEFDQLALKPHPDGWECWVVHVMASSTDVVDYEQSGLLIKGLRNVFRRPRGHLVGLIPLPSDAIEVYPVRDRGVRVTKVIVPQYALGYP